MSVPMLRRTARDRGLPAEGRKGDLVAGLLRDDLQLCSVDQLKELLRNRALSTRGPQEALQERLAAACSSETGPSLLPGTVDVMMGLAMTGYVQTKQKPAGSTARPPAPASCLVPGPGDRKPPVVAKKSQPVTRTVNKAVMNILMQQKGGGKLRRKY